MEDTESVRFRQIVVFGVRRNLRGAVLEENRRRLVLLTGNDGYAKIPVLQDGVSAPFSIPASPEAILDYRGIPYDLVEDLLPGSAAWRQVATMFLPRDETAVGQPITPLHGGHVGLLCTAGLLNGIFGAGDERHIARWRSVKSVTEFHEQEEDTRITRRREKWSNELRLIYVSGKTMKLTESPGEGEHGDGECTPENRDA